MHPRALADRLLDLTIAPGFSRVGHAVRRGGWDPLPSMDGRTVVVTGATSGIGRAAADGFAALGARTILLARDADKGRAAVAEIGGSAELVVGDLSSLESVRAAAADIAARAPRLDVLVNNAGVMAPERRTSVDGVELTFATNVLGMAVLTEALVDVLASSDPARPGRVVNVSSGGMYGQRLAADDPQSTHGEFAPVAVYARSKRAEVVLTEEWARRWADRGVVVHAMHPGWAATPGVADSLPTFDRVLRPLLRTPAQGADTILWLAAAQEPARSTGGFWHDRRERPTHRLPRTRETPAERARFLAELERLAAPGGTAA